MDATFQALDVMRKFCFERVKGLSPADLYQIPPGFSNNLIWNLGHIVVTPQVIAYGLSGLDFGLDTDFVARYRKGSQPSTEISQADIDLIFAQAFTLPAQLKADYEKGAFAGFKPYVTSMGMQLNTIEDALQFIPVHEGLHAGIIMSLTKFAGK